MSIFTKKDLGLFLPDDIPGDLPSLRHTISKEKTDSYELPKPTRDPSKKITRYRAGHVPKYAEYAVDDSFIKEPIIERKSTQFLGRKREKIQPIILTSKPGENKVREKIQAVILTNPKKTEQKVERVQESESESEGYESSSESSEEEDAIKERRKRLKEKLLQKEEEVEDTKEEFEERAIEHKAKVIEHEETESEETSTSSDSSSSSEEEDHLPSLPKPKFRQPKIENNGSMEDELAEIEKEKKEKKWKQKKEIKQLIKDELEREKMEKEMKEKGVSATEEMPNDTDGVNPEEEYQQWELRELMRLRRETDRRNNIQREKEEIERRRNMTEKERMEEDERLGKNKPKEKKQWKFMQKYYHKGVFYMDDKSIRNEEDIRKRRFDEPTLEDKFNKELMPKIMQVKNFGKSGRTKYTHLVDQDTSSRDPLYNPSFYDTNKRKNETSENNEKRQKK